ncbi:hypothetical protein JL722_11518 [Aureococcus anophagefferens]|nr:hypothetical protein JL722_11518 [Aureococcus anophagefferens]
MYALASERGSGRPARHGTFELALLYEKGCDWPGIGHGGRGCPVARDVPRSLELYGRAAAAGHPAAQLSMAVALASAFVLGGGRGPGQEKGEAGALDAYAAARAGAARGGGGGDEEEARAASEDVAVLHEYFGALGGDPLSQMALGWRHLHGAGVPARCDAALEYYAAAADAVAGAAAACSPGDRAPRGRLRRAAERLRRRGRRPARCSGAGGAGGAGDGAAAPAAPAGDAPPRAGDEPWRETPGGAALLGVGGSPDRGGDVLHYYRHAADQGDAQAMLALGHLHYHGSRGVAQDPARAFGYFLRAAEAGDDPAAFGWAGHCYALGLGVARDDAEAARWLAKGEDRGDAVALDALGVGGASRETKSPRARRKDAQKALQFFSLAAQNGHVAALHRVGRMYARALGVARSCEVAVNAYKTVAERGPWIAGLAGARHVPARRGGGAAYARLAEAGYEVAQSNAAWLLEAAAAGAPGGGAAACDGLPAAPAAPALRSRAAKQGHAAASLRLGDLYSAGRGAAGDLDEPARLARAVAHYQAAHELCGNQIFNSTSM